MIPVFVLTMSLAAGPPASPPWLTLAERSGFAETTRYEHTREECRKLEKSSPWIRLTSFGVSPEGRDLMLVIASRDKAFDPRAAQKTGKPVVLIQAGIHAGEIDGKDAGIMLLRDIVTGPEAKLLDSAIVLFMPIYNVDGHERFGPFNRVNQNGPREMGWRTTSRNLNLNRDYVKADAAETRAWLKLFNAWRPDLLIDCHVTDGADYQYDVTYWDETSPNSPPPVQEWMTRMVKERYLPEMASLGHAVAPYIFLSDDTDPAAGILNAPPMPRFSTSYAALQNRPAFLIETHMLKDYRTRVIGTYDTLRALLRAVNGDAGGLRAAVRRADETAARPGSLTLTYKVVPQPRKELFKGIAYRRELSEISGGVRIVYGDEPMEMEVDRNVGLAPDVEIKRPIAYLVPPQWTEAIERLAAHGLALKRLTSAATVEIEGYRLSEPEWQQAPFEGRHPLKFKAERIPAAPRRFPAGTIVVMMSQRASAVAAHLLEPQGPDSLAHWGFFDAIFEQKEYADAYRLEAMAREMLSENASLRAEFEARLVDPEFAASPARRLDFFFRRSPYWDDRVGLYPIGVMVRPASLPTEDLAAR